MHFKLSITGLTALLVVAAVAQDVSKLCTISPSGCTIGATACPTGCIKSARCQNPCPAQKTVVVTYTSRTTATTTSVSTKTTTSISTKTITGTKTVTATPTAKPAACAAQIPYINLFTFEDQYCSTLVDEDFDLLCILDDPQANFTFGGPPNKLNSPTLQTLSSGTQYPATQCIELAVQDSYSAYFTIDGLSGTNITKADCRVALFAGSGCTGFVDVYNINEANRCKTIALDDDAWKSAQFECSLGFGPV